MDGITGGMQLLGSDGGMVGTVDRIEGDRIKLARAPETAGGLHHYIPLAWVARVDEHVHLDRDAVLVREGWTAESIPDAPGHGGDRTRWVPWTVGVIGLIIILFLAVRAFQYGVEDQPTTVPAVDSDATGIGVGENAS